MAKLGKRNTRMGQRRPEGTFALRVSHRKEQGSRLPRYLVKCGCCDQNIEIHYSENTLEINGVMGSVEDWRELLLPLLGSA